MIQEILSDAKEKMQKRVTSLQTELGKLRTGRASLNVLDGVKVDYYGTPTPVNQVATLAVPEARLITIQPWEAHIIPDIEKAILQANLGLTPSNDGKVIRLSIPKLTEERRKDIVKQIKGIGEEARISVRHTRRDANEYIKKLEKDSQISEDELKKSQDQVQKITDEYIKQIDDILVKKEKDIMTV